MVNTKVNLTTRRWVGRGGKSPSLIAVHTMEAPEKTNTAENIANYFKTVKASAHWCVDNDSRVRVVNDSDTAWTLPPLNEISLNIELAGYAKQTPADWADAYSIAELEIAALCAAEWAVKFAIPVRKLSDAQLRNGEKGFIGHVDASRVFKKSTHWDPGPGFPWDYFLGRVNAHVGALGGVVTNAPSVHKAVDPGYSNAGFSMEYIKNIQRLLNAIGYNLEVDGRRGPRTINAIQDFQAKNGLNPDGLPGPQTKPKLEARANAKPSAPKTARPNVTQLQRAIRATPDNSWGPDTEKRLDTLREASRWGGQDFPYGVKFAQEVVGTVQDGSWGPASVRAHDKTVEAVQRALHAMGFDAGHVDGKWGPTSEAAYQAARHVSRR